MVVPRMHTSEQKQEEKEEKEEKGEGENCTGRQQMKIVSLSFFLALSLAVRV